MQYQNAYNIKNANMQDNSKMGYQNFEIFSLVLETFFRTVRAPFNAYGSPIN